MDYMTPFVRQVNLEDGTIPNSHEVVTRKLSHMRGFYQDADAEAALVAEDPTIYEVYYGGDIPEVEGQLRFCTTVLHAGKVGNEYFMTKGHYHAKRDRAEIYYGLSGEGMLLMQTPEGQVNVQRMTPGVVAFVPPFWGHRTVNVGSEDFIFLAVYPGDAGYNYGKIAETGFASLIVDEGGVPASVPNPNFEA